MPPCPRLSHRARYAEADDTLPDGTPVKRGARVFYAIYAMGRMVSVWGPDAAEFKPERWVTAEGRLRAESPFKFPVFNAGPRLCLGKDMAYLQARTGSSWVPSLVTSHQSQVTCPL